MSNLKVRINTFISSLHTYDYILFGISGALFLLLLILAIILRKKTNLSLLLVLISFLILLLGPISGYLYIHSTLYKNEISQLYIKRLQFSEALVIKGKVTNLGKQSFNKCKISASTYKRPDGILEEIVYPLKPFQKKSILKIEALDINESLDFKMILEPFTYSKEYNVSVKAECL